MMDSVVLLRQIAINLLVISIGLIVVTIIKMIVEITKKFQTFNFVLTTIQMAGIWLMFMMLLFTYIHSLQ